MAQIEVQNLTKKFEFNSNKGNFLKRLFKPEKKQITAVDDISFFLERGESAAFIGPNGAGKSTTIKMLAGILYPTSGNINILGLVPSKSRQKLAFQIGTVFGQRSQLSFHLPASDSFRLFSKIYEIEQTTFKVRLAELSELFKLGEFIDQPLRKLSLGQRMRCEIVASLLHKPQIIFLDEPTIGLDVVAKRELREVLKNLNKEWKTTILLTSHDSGDIEAVANRTIIINHGKIIFDDSTENLKRNYLKTKKISVRFGERSSDIKLLDCKIVKKGEFGLKLEVDNGEQLKKLLKTIVTEYSVEDINIENPSLDEIITDIYEK